MSQPSSQEAGGIILFSRPTHKRKRKASEHTDLPDEQPSIAHPSSAAGAGDPAEHRQAPAEASQGDDGEEDVQGFRGLGISEWLDRYSKPWQTPPC